MSDAIHAPAAQGLSLFHDDLSRAGADAEMELTWKRGKDPFLEDYVSSDEDAVRNRPTALHSFVHRYHSLDLIEALK